MRPASLRPTAVVGFLAVATSAAWVALPSLPNPAQAAITVREVHTRPANGVFALAGHGWGHGRGMSQYGAQGAASLGKTADEITSTYYPGTSKTVLPNTSIRIKLSVDTRAGEREFKPASGLYALDLATNTKIVLSSTVARWKIKVDAAGLHLLSLTGSTWSAPSKGYAGPLQVQGASFIRLLMADGSGRDYRNAVRVVKTGSTSVVGLAVMPMESYLYGVVPRESSSSWDTKALQSQSIAARSYSAYKREHAPTSQVYDICDTTQCQVFMGSAKYAASSDRNGTRTPLEATSTSQAIDLTKGVVRTYQGAAIFSEYSASNGGWSTAGGQPYLIAKADPWDGVTGSTSHLWSAKLPVASLEARYPQIGFFRTMTITQRDGNGEWGGRVLQVVLQGDAGSYTTTGSGIYNARTWPAYSDGVRSRWFRVVGNYDASLISRTTVPRLVLAPGNPRGAVKAVFRNTGSASWPVSGLHLTRSSSPGSVDPVSGATDKTRPGTFVRNLTTPGAASVAPGESAEFNVALDVSSQGAGTYATAYRPRLGTAATFGAIAAWTLLIEKPVFTAVVGRPPTLVSTTLPAVTGAPGALFADGRTVVVPRSGRTTVRLTSTNTGNVAWPVGSTTNVQIGTSAPRARESSFSGAGWISSNRAARVVASAPVAPGAAGTFDLPLNGNGKAAGVTAEAFEPLWTGTSWISGHLTPLTVVRVDEAVSRVAVTDRAPQTGITLINAPNARADLVVRLRNVGKDAWAVGQEQLRTTVAAPLRYRWPASNRPPALASNLSRPGTAQVYPGEIGQWVVPITGAGVKAGDYAMTFRAHTPAGVAYGPALTSRVTVKEAIFTYVLSSVRPSVDVPRNGTATTSFFVKNTGNVDWPVRGSLRSTVPSGSSPSQATSWHSATRPGPLTSNYTNGSLTVVKPGQTARFTITLAGNGRTPRTTSEVFGMVWDGWRGTTLRATLAYRIV